MAGIKQSPYDIIRKPRITEKAALLSSVDNSVVFEVHPRATKTDIKRAVEQIFEVKVKAVRTLNYLGKVRRVGGKMGRRGGWKKAYISLKEGSSIDLIEGL